MANPAADYTVELVTANPAAKVQVIGDQVLVATPADVGKVVEVAADGSLGLATIAIPPAPASGLLAERPAASPARLGMYYVATDVNGGTAYLCNGAAWVQTGKGVAERYLPLHVHKTASEARANTIVLAADNHLAVPMEANWRYKVELFLVYHSPAAADFKLQFDVPAGGASRLSSPRLLTTAATPDDPISGAAQLANATPYSMGAVGVSPPSTNVISLMLQGFAYAVGVAGNFTVSWSQVTANAGNTTVGLNSFLLLWPVRQDA